MADKKVGGAPDRFAGGLNPLVVESVARRELQAQSK
jgi:hypothetical protein